MECRTTGTIGGEQRHESMGTADGRRVGCKHSLGKASQQLAELLIGQPRIPDDVTHRNGVDWIVPWDCDDPGPIRHHNMLALARDAKSRLL